MKSLRKYGILLPISALPSGEGIGTLGKHAYRFIDYMAECGATVWQVLPLNPTNYGDSPYQSCSADALNYYFIDLETLAEDGLLTSSEVELCKLSGNGRRVDYGKQFTDKIALLKKAYTRFDGGEDFENFAATGDYFDFALFMSIKEKSDNRAFAEWESRYRLYSQNEVDAFVENNSEEIRFWTFTQYIFLKQWNALKAYANARGISIMGDIPLYVAYDSAEVWKYGGKLFKMDEERNADAVAGCPPDGFTADGQLWGNPVYDWQKMKEDGYSWWRRRIKRCFELFDILRIDHFRGFDRYWEVPASEKTARNGKWVDGPKEELFNGLLDRNVVAEDLGVIDDGVRRLMKNVGYPGMKILEFAFDGVAENEHKPSNYSENFVCYTGTHDNMPIRQYIADLREAERKIYLDDLMKECEKAGIDCDFSSERAITFTVIRLAFFSAANTVIIPLWDLLALGREARMNLPSTVSRNNWSWRFVESDFTDGLKDFLKEVSKNSYR